MSSMLSSDRVVLNVSLVVLCIQEPHNFQFELVV